MAPFAPGPAVPDDTVERMAPEPPASVFSELDRWAKRVHGKQFADELPESALFALGEHILELAERTKRFWRGRDDRMMADQEVFALQSRKPPLGKDHLKPEELEAQNAEMVTLPDPWLFCLKVENMIASAGVRINKPSQSLQTTQAAQMVENFLLWAWRKIGEQQRQSGGSSALQQLAHQGGLRGWMTVLVMPDSTHPHFPYRVDFEDASNVYPRFTKRGIAYVLRCIKISVDEARYEYPEAESLLEQCESDEQVEVTGYYDSIYHAIIIRTPADTRRGHRVVRPVRHEIVDLDGNNVNPWIIGVPLGDMRGPSKEDSTWLYGPGLLYPVHEIYNLTNKLVSLLVNNIALTADPPALIKVKSGATIPEKIELTPGARNYLIWDQQEITVIDTAPNPGNLGPAMAIVADRNNKATLPSVAWGDAGSITSGYGVGMLSNAVNQVLQPYSESVLDMVTRILQRVMDIAYNITTKTRSTLAITTQASITGRTYSGVPFQPALIGETGNEIEVKLGQVTPQEKGAVAQYIMGLVQTGIISRYDALVELGYPDPLLVFQRKALETLLMEPGVAMSMGPMALTMSDEDFMQAVYAKSEELKRQAMQQEEALRQQGLGGLPNTAVPTTAQVGPNGRAGMPPQGQSAAEQGEAANNQAIAQLLATQGGSPPAL